MYKNNFTSKSYRNFKKVSINNFYKLFDNKINDLLFLSIFILTSLTNNAICQFVVIQNPKLKQVRMGILNTRTITQTNKGLKMTKKYKYKVQEYSQDTRHFFIESAVELDEDEINDCITNVSLDEPNTYEDDDYKVSFKGTEYGDDSQVDIREVK
jgi:hypothetical protein